MDRDRATRPDLRTHWPTVVLMLGQRRRRWTNIKAAVSERLGKFAGAAADLPQSTTFPRSLTKAVWDRCSQKYLRRLSGRENHTSTNQMLENEVNLLGHATSDLPGSTTLHRALRPSCQTWKERPGCEADCPWSYGFFFLGGEGF